ncbi:GH25 family lysozyme [Secundilactobacillus paracollinoides]|uniref:Lysozyme n=1 Tax=Secundilactobacillus paracollinoides TaxID=240427 RepID=A0A1B2IVX3_9LACO|nr:GH25 family lysozyme [Secundilactobacillus paracollinoides]ANZ60387.1 lysozyme [Secundilactobacillus paracollinoides]ANZ66216.1 lysozyme [Secundilactobacillus paracollinoides]
MRKLQHSKLLLLGAVIAGVLGTTSVVTAHASLTPSSSQPNTDMVDLSSWQSNLTSSDYQNLAQAGVKAVAIKASEGTSYTSPVLASQTSDAQGAGLAVNYYHFAHFTTVAEAQAEAQNFINSVQAVTNSKNMVMVVDFEDSAFSGLSKSTNDANLAAFDAVLNQAGYNKTDLYTMASWVGKVIDTNDSNKGWLAQWPANPSGSAYPSANAWQWTSDYRFNGENQDLDVSQLNNSYYLDGATSTPTTSTTTDSSSSTKASQPTTTLVKVPAPSTSSYSASRSNSVKLVWRASMKKHAYHTTAGARYSKHLGIRYDYNKNLPNVTWYTNQHEKLYRKSKGDYIIYYHVNTADGKHGGWIWRGYLKAGVNPAK